MLDIPIEYCRMRTVKTIEKTSMKKATARVSTWAAARADAMNKATEKAETKRKTLEELEHELEIIKAKIDYLRMKEERENLPRCCDPKSELYWCM